jgi:hypothetical protein
MQNIEQVLQQNSVRVGILLRKHRITGPPTMDTIKKAFEQKGERFMLELMEIIVPDQSNFEALITPRSGAIATQPIDTKKLAPMNTTTAQPPGGFWSFWDKLLNTVDNTGEAIQKFKTDLQTDAPPQYDAAAAAQAASQTKTLYLVAAGFVALIVIILLVRK